VGGRGHNEYPSDKLMSDPVSFNVMPNAPAKSLPTKPVTKSETAEKTLSPAMRQYREFKSQYPGYVLFFRMGDFYEMFWDDAIAAHKALGVALTSRNKGSPDEIPMD